MTEPRTKEQFINDYIKESGCDTNLISDGYHPFKELYDHRIELFIALCRILDAAHYEARLNDDRIVWRSKFHSDNSTWDGWFIAGIGKDSGEQISYHLPMEYWDRTEFMETLDKAPKFDGHTSADVLERLRNL